jgi:hypothetical protein
VPVVIKKQPQAENKKTHSDTEFLIDSMTKKIV